MFDAQAFIEEHEHFIKALYEGEAFSVKGGSVTLRFDDQGNLRKIEKSFISFKG